MSDNSDLFDSCTLGDIKLANRVVMAPLTRSRSGANGVQTAMHATYYAQRATAGLIISEATQISLQAQGYAFTPGIYTDEQMEGWKLVTNAVHQQHGKIFAQLWHVGRISHPDLQPNHQLPVAPSAIKPEGKAFTAEGFKDFVVPKELDTDEIKAIVGQYAHAAACALNAGFDGIELHAANGYLLAQFLCDKTNKRHDRYGGSIENRARLLFEVLEAVLTVWPAQKVGIRLSPVSHANDIEDSDPTSLYTYVIENLNPYNIAYIHCVEGETMGPRNASQPFDFKKLKDTFNGVYIANNGYDKPLALQARQHNLADLICFGRPFIANPDLVLRLQKDLPLAAEAPKDSWYGGGNHGYTDWPTV